MPPAPPMILDHDLLAEDLAHARAHDARDGVDRAARRKGHDKVDRPRRPALRLCGCDDCERATAAAMMVRNHDEFLPRF